MSTFLIAVLAGFAAGIISGFGVGGGTLLMIYLTLIAEIPQTAAQGINLLYFIPTSAAALILHSKNRFIRKDAVLPAALCGCAAAAGASFLALTMDLGLLKKLFGGFLLLTGLFELFRKPTQPKNRR